VEEGGERGRTVRISKPHVQFMKAHRCMHVILPKVAADISAAYLQLFCNVIDDDICQARGARQVRTSTSSSSQHYYQWHIHHHLSGKGRPPGEKVLLDRT
jgi:hypothetical protein